jgi:SAM-dependent methyltransferase
MDDPRLFWEQRFGRDGHTYGEQPNAYFRQQLDALPVTGRLLLLAEGEGRNAVYAASKGWEVTAVDFSENGREKALALAARHGVTIHYHVADLAQYNIEAAGNWDAIGLIYAHLPPGLRLQVHRQCAEALLPGGRLILEAFHTRQLGNTSGGPQRTDMLYHQAMLEADFQGLHVMHGSETAVLLEEGAGHAGMGEVVRLLLLKPLNNVLHA